MQKHPYKPSMPNSFICIIVVGNLTIGGTGKTPMVIWITKLLEKNGYKPGIVSRGYGGSSPKNPIIISDDTSVDVSGDEPLIIYKNTLQFIKVYFLISLDHHLFGVRRKR